MDLRRYSPSFTILHIPLFFSFLLTLMSSRCDGHDILCKAREREALLHFKNGLSGYSDSYYYAYYPKKKVCSSWVPEKEEDCCKWEGIGCDNRTGHVSKLTLPGAKGNISHSLVNLSYLQHLDLNNGDFGGSSIPEFFECFKRLRYLDLSSSRFQGDIPSQLGNLSALQVLNLSYIYEITSDGMWISGLSSLQYLDMSSLNLSQATSLFNELNKLPFISYLELSSCELDSVSLSVLDANFPELSFLDLSYNNLNESRRYQWIFNLTSLEYLDLSNSNDGILNVGDIAGNLCNLRSLNLSSNNIMTSIGNFFQGCRYRLYLEELNLSGNQITGQLPSWLGEYKNSFKTLDVSENLLSGPIPKLIGGLKSLQYLDLSYNELGGHIPTSIGGLTSCQILYLSNNNFSGHIPVSIGNLTSCQELDLSDNKFDGHIPMSIGSLTACVYMDLSNNEFEGHIPTSVGDLISCSSLYMSKNNLSGCIPSSISKLHSLDYLDLSGNSLEGIVSEEHFHNLSRLRYVDLSGNSLEIMLTFYWAPPFSLLYLDMASCKVGPHFPLWLETQVQLQHLNMSNSSIYDVLPKWIWNISLAMRVMDISKNMLWGTVPAATNESCFHALGQYALNNRYPLVNRYPLGSYYQGSIIDLHENMLEGTLSSFPTIIGGSLKLSKNLISGPINLRDVSKLLELDVSKNNLSGIVPSFLFNATHIRVLDLSDNHLTGKLPYNQGNYGFSNLSCFIISMHLNKNILRGTLPAWLKNCNDMLVFDVGDNIFAGNIPRWIAKSMLNLQVLRLGSNLFYGKIPSDLSRLEHLQVLDLAKNNLSGDVPHNMGDFFAMKSRPAPITDRSISVTEEYVQVTLKGCTYRYYGLLNFMRSIDLSENKLSGEIPDELGKLCLLINLNLSHNYFIGHIPESFGNLKHLESFDLSRNNLSGGIPQSLTQMTSLTTFNISFNHLSGRIATGQQFNTFESSSYLGNKMLCGYPLGACRSPQPATPSINTNIAEGTSDYYRWLCFYVSLGFIVGFWTFWITLIFLIKSIWRYAYFHFLDNKCQKFISLFKRKPRNA